MTQTDRFLEYTSLSPPPDSSVRGRVDRERGIIRNVKILGTTSANNRTYPASTIAKAAGLYEGAKVNVDHPTGHLDKSRSYSDRIGVLRNVRPESDGLRGDLHANPQHALWEQLAWDAENAPESAGFSHNIIGKTSTHGGKVVVEEITRVTSVDLVADPATTRGLFEGAGPVGHATRDMSPAEVRAEIHEEIVKEPWAEQHEVALAHAEHLDRQARRRAAIAESKSYPEISAEEFLAQLCEPCCILDSRPEDRLLDIPAKIGGK